MQIKTMKKVFISYSRWDSSIVDRVVTALEHAGIEVWIDRDGIESCDSFKSTIVRAIEQSDCLLFSHRNHRTPHYGLRKRLGLQFMSKKESFQ